MEEKNDKVEKRKEISKETNSYKLDIIANINLVIFIITSVIVMYISASDTVINWIGISAGVITLLSGITVYFLLKTIVDIFAEVENNIRYIFK